MIDCTVYHVSATLNINLILLMLCYCTQYISLLYSGIFWEREIVMNMEERTITHHTPRVIYT